MYFPTDNKKGVRFYDIVRSSSNNEVAGTLTEQEMHNEDYTRETRHSMRRGKDDNPEATIFGTSTTHDRHGVPDTDLWVSPEEKQQSQIDSHNQDPSYMPKEKDKQYDRLFEQKKEIQDKLDEILFIGTDEDIDEANAELDRILSAMKAIPVRRRGGLKKSLRKKYTRRSNKKSTRKSNKKSTRKYNKKSIK